MSTSSSAPTLRSGAGTLTRASGLVADARVDLDQLSTRLSGQIDAVRGRWGGEGAVAFFALHQAWTERHARVVRALDGLAESLTTTDRDNTATDQATAAAMARLAARLGGR